MDFKKLGAMLFLLGCILGSVAAYYAFLPRLQQDAEVDLIVQSSQLGYRTAGYLEMKAKLAQAEQRKMLFAWAGGISIFLGFALSFSAKKDSGEKPADSA